MFKKVFKCFTLSAMVATMFIGSACQKDTETEQDVMHQQSITDFHDCCLNVYDTTGNDCISKAVVRKKYGKVVINNGEYKTIKIRNREATIMQEWLYEDLHEDMFTGRFFFQNEDTKGENHGYYYPWCGSLDDVIQDDWDEFCSEQGFRIPTAKDLTDLRDVVGKNNRGIILNVELDGFYYPDFPLEHSYITNNGGFWINAQNDPNRVSGCGVIANWYGDDLLISYTNNKDICCNVRLVRTLNQSQW